MLRATRAANSLGERDRFVERVGVQALRAAEHGGERLDRGADDVVVRVVLGERHAGRLAVRAEHERRRLLRAELLDRPRPQQARGAQLGHLHEEVHADPEEEGQARRELVDVETAFDGRACVLDPVGQREAELLHRGRAGFLHVVAGDRDRVELRHAARRVLDDVGDDPQARRRRVDVGVADHELFEDVVLERAGELFLGHALLLGGDDVAGHHRQHRAVHRHRHAHLVERDLVEEDLHVLDGVDRDAGLADVADDTRVIAVVAAVRGEVERHREPHLSGREVGAVEGVRLLGGGEARVLADGPRSVGVHGGPHAAQEGLEPGQRVDRLRGLRGRRRCRAA